MSKRFMVVVAACIVGLGIIFYFTKSSTNSPTKSTNSNAKPSSHIEGNGKKGVTLIEYGDFQCPACGAYYPLVKAIQAKFNDDIFFQFRNFPLFQVHQNAIAGARAAEAASLQAKYWEMHDILYEQQTTWSAVSTPYTYFAQYAQQLGLDMTKFQQDYNSSSVNDTIQADIAQGNKLALSSTPSFVLDGKKLDQNPASQEAFEKLITDEIAVKNK